MNFIHFLMPFSRIIRIASNAFHRNVSFTFTRLNNIFSIKNIMLNIMGKIFPLPCNLTSVCNSCNTCLFFLLYQLIQVLEVMPDLLHAKFNCILLPVEIVMWNCQLDCILYFLVKIHQPHCNSETLLLIHKST